MASILSHGCTYRKRALASTDLPAFPEMTLAMYRAQPDQGPAVQRLASLLVEAVRQHATGGPGQP